MVPSSGIYVFHSCLSTGLAGFYVNFMIPFYFRHKMYKLHEEGFILPFIIFHLFRSGGQVALHVDGFLKC